MGKHRSPARLRGHTEDRDETNDDVARRNEITGIDTALDAQRGREERQRQR